MKRSLVIGMGIGSMYKSVLSEMGHSVVTVDTDPSKNADFLNLTDALKTGKFDTVHICTPNHTHLPIAKAVSPYLPYLCFIEKPGFKTAADWSWFISSNPATRWNLVKNNQYRTSGIEGLIRFAERAQKIDIVWENKDRVPFPGSWFTTKSESFGGVSRDLMPHLLSWLSFLFPTDYHRFKCVNAITEQRWTLSDLTSSDYGVVNQNGVYDTDDIAILQYKNHNRNLEVNLLADWRQNERDNRCIKMTLNDDSTIVFNFDLCPEDAYENMIEQNLYLLSDDYFWNCETNENIWIHEQIEKLQ